ncbi:hypothetical protein NC974_19880 [Leptolyngbya sp. SLC-A1]|nr:MULTISPECIES: hypothetical protein [unclassified Phormidium]
MKILEVNGALVIRKKALAVALTLSELLTSIPADFQYPDDVHDLVDGLA